MKSLLAWAMVLVLGAAPAWAQREAPVVQAENAFAVDLYGKLAKQPGNLFFSPYSISTALGMVFVGAKGTTADEIAKALHLGPGWKPADVKADVLFPQAQPDGFKFNSANALWCAKGYHFESDYLAGIKNNFGGDARRVNFDDPVRAAGKINDWVAKETQGKIQNLISPEALKAATRLVLTNAVYFKAGWAEPFDITLSDQEKFHIAPGNDAMTEMMHQTGDFMLTQGDGAKILSIPYRGFDASLVIILPDANTGLSKVEAGLSADELSGWLANNQYTLVALTLPRIESTQQFDLKQVLMALGIEQAFSPEQADLTGIANNPDGRLYVSDVIHKANVDIDETGTEAAAATAISVASAGIEMGPPPVPVPFVADHPFIYLIRSNQSGDILFMGRVDDPTQTGG